MYGYLYAKSEGGKFILRLEDTDSKRYVEGDPVQIIYDTLKDAGIFYDEGPDIGGPCGPYVQSERASIYKEYAEKLVEPRRRVLLLLRQRAASIPSRTKTASGGTISTASAFPKKRWKKNLKAGVPYVIRQNVPEEGSGSYEDLVYGTVTRRFQGRRRRHPVQRATACPPTISPTWSTII